MLFRQNHITNPGFTWAKTASPALSETEAEAISSGTSDRPAPRKPLNRLVERRAIFPDAPQNPDSFTPRKAAA
ncbi:hypothetical protein [uncultured Pseudosulfitobacter sp.]|jgi:hypothetical protein|uniref:hypothetical protein n=1 Tax=uncultured Pseudosulfitobacter sp. TaxID=2854214 RepID=UPI0030DC4596|tara:strand:- start:453 stop:671 length:219 start_codon:yes stop_codon:yes gene_type:complete